MNRQALLMLALLPGSVLAWEAAPGERPVTIGRTAITVRLPDGWLYESVARSIKATRDGPLLEQVSISLAPHREAFAAAKKPSGPDYAPEDLADAYLANLQSGAAALAGVVVLQTSPDELAGRPAFRVHLRYRAAPAEGGAEMEETTVGTALDTGLLLATYRAPSLHYFSTWQAAFDAVVRSVATAAPAHTR